MDAVFRKPSEPTEPRETPKSSPGTVAESKVEVPYLDYEHQNSKPYIASYLGLGDMWDDPQGGFPKEVLTIENYIRTQIESGEIANSMDAVKEKIKSIEKMTNMDKESRAVVKAGVLAAYVKFMGVKDDIKANIRRYGSR